MGRNLVLWKRFKNNLEILCHPVCNRLYLEQCQGSKFAATVTHVWQTVIRLHVGNFRIFHYLLLWQRKTSTSSSKKIFMQLLGQFCLLVAVILSLKRSYLQWVNRLDICWCCQSVLLMIIVLFSAGHLPYESHVVVPDFISQVSQV